MPRTLPPLPPADQLLQLAVDAGWRVNSLAGKLNLSPRQLERRFQRLIGVSPHRWIDMQRCAVASEGLSKHKQSKWVAGDVGFSSPAHFSRWFKAHMMLTATSFVHKQ